jgi:hypothetical protein
MTQAAWKLESATERLTSSEHAKRVEPLSTPL